MFSNREIAVGFWGLALRLYGLTTRAVRKSGRGVLRSLLHPKILTPIVLASLYVAGVVACLRALGVWTGDLAKDTLLWFLFSGLVVAFSLVTSYRGENLFRSITADSVKVVVIIEFITSTYTLSLPAELLLVPALFSLGAMQAIAGTDEKYAAVGRLLKSVEIAIGFGILYFAVRDAIADYRHLRTLDTLRAVALAPILSILFLPFVYLLLLYVNYESLFIRLKIGAEKPRDLQRYARRRLVRHLGLRLGRVRTFLSTHGPDLMRVRTKDDLDTLLRSSAASPTGMTG